MNGGECMNEINYLCKTASFRKTAVCMHAISYDL